MLLSFPSFPIWSRSWVPRVCRKAFFSAPTLSSSLSVQSIFVVHSPGLLLMGPLSDIYGRKPVLLLSLFGSCFGSLFQGMSRSMTSLIIWRAFTGLFAGSMILVQAYGLVENSTLVSLPMSFPPLLATPIWLVWRVLFRWRLSSAPLSEAFSVKSATNSLSTRQPSFRASP